MYTHYSQLNTHCLYSTPSAWFYTWHLCTCSTSYMRAYVHWCACCEEGIVYTRTHTVQRKLEPVPPSLSHSLTSPVYRESIKSKIRRRFSWQISQYIPLYGTVSNQTRTVQYPYLTTMMMWEGLMLDEDYEVVEQSRGKGSKLQ